MNVYIINYRNYKVVLCVPVNFTCQLIKSHFFQVVFENATSELGVLRMVTLHLVVPLHFRCKHDVERVIVQLKAKATRQNEHVEVVLQHNLHVRGASDVT